jgi:hypothetical protein
MSRIYEKPPQHGRDCDPACRCEANIASGRGGSRQKIPPTVELLRQLSEARAQRDHARQDLDAQERITGELAALVDALRARLNGGA